MSEYNRIREVYLNRDKSGKRALYSWSNLHSLYQSATKSRMLSIVLRSSFKNNLSNLTVLDVGCGSGNFLRQLVEWGVEPANCTGTEFLDERIEKAKQISPKEIYYHLGNLEFDRSEVEKKSILLVLILYFHPYLKIERERS